MNVTTGRERKLPPFVLGLVFGALSSLVAAPAVFAATVPDSTTLDHLRASATGLNRFRVETDRGQFVIGSFDVDPAGVRVQVGQKVPALVTASSVAPEQRRIEWARIERIDGMHSHGLRGALIGALVGTLIAFEITDSFDHGNLGGIGEIDGFPFLLVPATFGVCTGAGALIGVSTGWRRLYP